MTLTKKLGAEFIGTFWLVLGGWGPLRLHPVNTTPYFELNSEFSSVMQKTQ